MQAINKRRLSGLYVAKVQPQARAFLVWDADQMGLALQVQPSGHSAYKLIYRHHKRSRWFHIGDVKAIGLADARTKAAELMLAVVRDGKDPAAEKRIGRQSATFGALASRYVEEYAKRKNKSWPQADQLVRRYLLPMWGELDASAITRADVRAVLAKVNGPVAANQVLASASAIFTWAGRQEILTNNPCRGVEPAASACCRTVRFRCFGRHSTMREWPERHSRCCCYPARGRVKLPICDLNTLPMAGGRCPESQMLRPNGRVRRTDKRIACGSRPKCAT